MFKNYLYLLRCIKDLSNIVTNTSLEEVYTQEKDKLFFNIRTNDRSNFHLVISANSQLTYIAFKNDHFKAKKNVKNFFSEFLPDKILKPEIALGDRVVKLTLYNSSIYFVIRGSNTNIFLIDKEFNIHVFKKIEKDKLESIKQELTNTKYISTTEPIIELLRNKSKEEILEQYKFIDRELIREIEKRNGDWKSNLINIVSEIYNSEIMIEMNDKLPKPKFIPATFKNETKNEIFSDYFSAINKYLMLYYSVGKDKIIKNELEKFVDKTLERISNKLNNLKAKIETGSKEEDYFYNGNLLLSNINLLKKGMNEAGVKDSINDRLIKIKLEEKWSPRQNINNYFEQARSEKINYIKSKELFTRTQNEYKKYIELRTRIDESNSFDDLLSIKKELKHKMEIQKNYNGNDKEFHFRHFLLDGKYHVYIGKDGKNNDILTTKFAKQNDFWFHARSVPGSHVVLRVENVKEVIPKTILKKVASIAAFYSKAKTSKLAPVSYTFKKFVVKKKGLDPGQVILLKENVLIVSPEIPPGCESLIEE